MKKQFRSLWLHHMGVGVHALLASMLCVGIVKLLLLGASWLYYMLTSDYIGTAWVEAVLSIGFFVLIGLPVFGFFFSRLYPKTDIEHSIETPQS